MPMIQITVDQEMLETFLNETTFQGPFAQAFRDCLSNAIDRARGQARALGLPAEAVNVNEILAAIDKASESDKAKWKALRADVVLMARPS